MSKKITNILKILVIGLITIAFISSFIVSQNQAHLDNCHEDNCSICAVIHMSQAIIQIASLICLFRIFECLIQYVLSKMHNYNYVVVSNSLILQNVQLNE